MGVFSGNPKEEPLHYGEVSSIWGFLMTAKLSLTEYQTLLNHAGDTDLRAFIKDTIDDVLKPEIERIENVLKENGVGLPPAPPDRPVADLDRIPEGARFNDPEIAAVISAGISAGLISCSGIMALAVREDIGMMFGEIHLKKAQSGLRMLRLMKEKGWLVTPPLHKPELAGTRA